MPLFSVYEDLEDDPRSVRDSKEAHKSVMVRALFVLAALTTASAGLALESADAARIVQNIFGGLVSHAETGRGADDRDYILAVWQETELTNHNLRLLRSFAGTYVEVWRHEAAPWVGSVELLDINHDGFLDVYWTENSFGNMFGGIFHRIFDGASREVVVASFTYEHGQRGREVEIDETLRSFPELLSFIEKRLIADSRLAEADAALPDPADPDDAQEVWMTRYGAFARQINDRARIDPATHPGDIRDRSQASVMAVLHRGPIELISLFQDAVYVVDTEDGISWVLYVPHSSFGWIDEFNPMGSCIELVPGVEHSSMAASVFYDPLSRTLHWDPDACFDSTSSN